MALNSWTLTSPDQTLGAGDTFAQRVEQFTGVVEATLARASKAYPMLDTRPVKGTDTITNQGIGESTLQVITPGQTPDGTSQNQTNKTSLTVDTVILARSTTFTLDVIQKNFDWLNKVGIEHGKKVGKFLDNAAFIMAAKTAAMSASAYGALPGHFGGTTKTLSASGDATDPAALYSALSDLLYQMEEKDVDPVVDGVMVAVRPQAFYALMDAEQIVNGEYTTAAGNVINGMKMLKGFGVPIVSSNNVPNTNVTAHSLSNARNSNAYNGDFTKLVAVAFAPDALLAGESIPLETKVWFDDGAKVWNVDAWLSAGIAPNRTEKAGRIMLP